MTKFDKFYSSLSKEEKIEFGFISLLAIYGIEKVAKMIDEATEETIKELINDEEGNKQCTILTKKIKK